MARGWKFDRYTDGVSCVCLIITGMIVARPPDQLRPQRSKEQTQACCTDESICSRLNAEGLWCRRYWLASTSSSPGRHERTRLH
jgi:hypothetical protein